MPLTSYRLLSDSKRPGDVAKLTVFRDGKTIEKDVTLKPRAGGRKTDIQ